MPRWVPGPVAGTPLPQLRNVKELHPLRGVSFPRAFDAPMDLAADGTRVAFAGCTVWDVRLHRRWGPRFCSKESADAVALAANRLAWLQSRCSCATWSYVDVRFADPGDGQPREAAFSAQLHEDRSGTEAANVVGDGSLVAFNLNQFEEGGGLVGRQLWTIPRSARGAGPCPHSRDTPDDPGAGRFCRRVRAGDGASVLDVDRGRLLAVRDDGSLLLIGVGGRLVRTWKFAAGEVVGAALTGERAIVTTGDELRAYDTRTGSLRVSWPLPRRFAPPRIEDAYGGVAVYVQGGAEHLIRLRDGHDVVLHVAAQSAFVTARLERPGLYYLYNKSGAKRPGRTVFVPWSTLSRWVSRAVDTTPRQRGGRPPVSRP